MAKPEWGSHDWPQIVQDSNGNWYGVTDRWVMAVTPHFKGDELNLLREDGEFLSTDQPNPDWRSSLERRPRLEPVLVPPPAATQHSHYFIPVPAGLTQLDVYRLCLLAGVTDPCAQHILKKVLRPGQRGAKSERQDWENIRDTAVRRLAMMDEDGVA